MRRLLLLALLGASVACVQPARAATIELVKGTGDSTVHVVRDARAVLYRGGTVDGLPALRTGKPETIPWARMRHLLFIPGDIPTVIITYRDGGKDEVDVEPG